MKLCAHDAMSFKMMPADSSDPTVSATCSENADHSHGDQELRARSAWRACWDGDIT